MADTRHRPQSCRCCLPTQAAGWGTVIRLERGVGGNAQTSVSVCVCLLVSQSRTRLMSRLAGCNRHPELCGRYWCFDGVWYNPLLLTSPSLLYQFLSFIRCIWLYLGNCFAFIFFYKQTQAEERSFNSWPGPIGISRPFFSHFMRFFYLYR